MHGMAPIESGIFSLWTMQLYILHNCCNIFKRYWLAYISAEIVRRFENTFSPYFSDIFFPKTLYFLVKRAVLQRMVQQSSIGAAFSVALNTGAASLYLPALYNSRASSKKRQLHSDEKIVEKTVRTANEYFRICLNIFMFEKLYSNIQLFFILNVESEKIF